MELNTCLLRYFKDSVFLKKSKSDCEELVGASTEDVGVGFKVFISEILHSQTLLINSRLYCVFPHSKIYHPSILQHTCIH